MAAPSASASMDAKTFLSTVGSGTRKDCRAKQIIFAQGYPANCVFYVEKGKVKLVVLSKQSKEAVIAILGKDDFVGEGCLGGQPLRIARASAMTDCSARKSPGASESRQETVADLGCLMPKGPMFRSEPLASGLLLSWHALH